MWPVLFKWGSILVPSYLVVNSIVFCLAALWVSKRAARYNVTRNQALDVYMLVMAGGFIGGRAFHILFEDPQFYFQNPSYIFKFWYGGFVFYGGVIVGFLGGLLYCKLKKLDPKPFLDIAAPVAAFGYALGRFGCLLAGCCYGRATTLPWGITFPPGSEAPSGMSLHPTQLYFSAWDIIAGLLLMHAEKRHSKNIGKGGLFALWILFHALGRALIEQFRGDFRGRAIFNLSISTWISLIGILLSLIWLAKNYRSTKNASSSS